MNAEAGVPKQNCCSRRCCENVDAPERLDRFVDLWFSLRLTGDVELDERKVLACDIVQSIADFVEIAASRDHAVTNLQCRPGCCCANAAAGMMNQTLLI